MTTHNFPLKYRTCYGQVLKDNSKAKISVLMLAMNIETAGRYLDTMNIETISRYLETMNIETIVKYLDTMNIESASRYWIK